MVGPWSIRGIVVQRWEPRLFRLPLWFEVNTTVCLGSFSLCTFNRDQDEHHCVTLPLSINSWSAHKDLTGHAGICAKTRNETVGCTWWPIIHASSSPRTFTGPFNGHGNSFYASSLVVKYNVYMNAILLHYFEGEGSLMYIFGPLQRTSSWCLTGRIVPWSSLENKLIVCTPCRKQEKLSTNIGVRLRIQTIQHRFFLSSLRRLLYAPFLSHRFAQLPLGAEDSSIRCLSQPAVGCSKPACILCRRICYIICLVFALGMWDGLREVLEVKA